MLAQLTSAAVRGVEAYPVRVEVHVTSGLPAFSVVGLPHGAVREGRERVMAALANVGRTVPPHRITVNLAPADVPKEGSAFDLPIALGVVTGLGWLDPASLASTAFLGELGLDGVLRPTRGAVSIAAACRDAGVRSLLLPADNAAEAAVVSGITVFGAGSLDDALDHLTGEAPLEPTRLDPLKALSAGVERGPDLRDVRGQAGAKRALEIAAAGGHNLLLVGPPGAGKTMLARRLPGILPPLTLDEALEVTRVHSVAGLLPRGRALVARRPFRAPHHTISDAGLVGGGNPPRPGEASLAHHGVLFLDELPEFRRHVLEALRQPLEDGWVTIARARSTLSFPARAVLVAAMNPCPCGFWGDPSDRCTCDPTHVRRYRARVSGPLLDRIELRVAVSPVAPAKLEGDPDDRAGSEHAAERVVRARALQEDRFAGVAGVYGNGQMSPEDVRRHCALSSKARAFLRRAAVQLHLSARGYHRTLKVARTVADLEGEGSIDSRHLAEALQYRGLEVR